MRTSELSFLSPAKKITLASYNGPRNFSVILSETIGRIAATILLSPAAACDFLMHTFFVIPTFVYAIGKSVILWKADFTLPWQHIQRVRNAVAPLFLGSLFSIIHPFAGLLVSEETDKHAFAGMISSNTSKGVDTPCSPIHSLSIVERIAKKHRYETVEGKKVEIFTKEQISAIHGARSIEKGLESIHAQEFIHKVTNITLYVLALIKLGVEDSYLSEPVKGVLTRLSGVLVPVLSVVDLTIAAVVQGVFLLSGFVHLLSGRGPIYTEITLNPLMHIAFFIQNTLKLVGNFLGTLVWFVSPMTGFKVSLLPTHLFFKLQMKIMMLSIRWKMHCAKENTRFVIPIAFAEGECSALSFPAYDSHKTYLIVEKKKGKFNLYWVNRPDIDCKKDLSTKQTYSQIESMINERYPFMDINKMMDYPVKATKPVFNGTSFGNLDSQGNYTNCVVSNLFGMIEALDRINGKEPKISRLRNRVVRKALLSDYSFYKNDFHPFMSLQEGYSMRNMYDCGETDDPI
jgi:hypothetical protein